MTAAARLESGYRALLSGIVRQPQGISGIRPSEIRPSEIRHSGPGGSAMLLTRSPPIKPSLPISEALSGLSQSCGHESIDESTVDLVLVVLHDLANYPAGCLGIARDSQLRDCRLYQGLGRRLI